MKKILLVACSLWLASFAVNAQKYAIIDTKYILDKMPDIKMRKRNWMILLPTGKKKLMTKQTELDKMYQGF